MQAQETLRLIDSIARDRNIEPQLIIDDLRRAMCSAARKYFNTLDADEFTCEFDRLSGEFTLFRHGHKQEFPPEALGRIAAQTFKQVMIQGIRDDERQATLEEYSKRIGEIVTGTAQRYEGGSLVVTIDRAESFMPRSEQIPGEQFNPNERVRCLLLDVREAGSQVKIVISRAHPDFIKRLFEVEVPEVMDRTIEVKAMAREAGYRTKMAVASIDSKVDAVGACVGVRGSRIKNIVDELNGEKIDIVRWNESSQILIQNSLKPAEVSEISLCFELGRATVVVRDDQLSLAIGKRGQNVRLAARLTGWDIDILTPEEFNKGLEILNQTILTVEGVQEDVVDRLAALGMVSVFDLEEIGADLLVTEFEIEQELADRIVQTCADRAREVHEQMQRDKEEAEQRRIEEEEQARKLMAGELGEGEVSTDLAAAAILGGAGPMQVAEGADAETAVSETTEAGVDALLGGEGGSAAGENETNQ